MCFRIGQQLKEEETRQTPAGDAAVWGQNWDPGSRAGRSPSGHTAMLPPLTEGQPLGTRSFWTRHVTRRLHPAALFHSNQPGFQYCIGPSAVALHTEAQHSLAAGFWCMAVSDSRGTTCTDPLAQPQSHTYWSGDPQQLSDPQRART